MKNQVDYFEKCIKILKDLKSEHPDVEISKHYCLAVDGDYSVTDRELYLALQKHKNELDINTLSDKDLARVVEETDELFQEIDYDESIDGKEDEYEDDF